MFDRLRAICASLPEAEEYVMVHHPAFRVGKKPFAIFGLDGRVLSIKFDRETQPAVLADPRFVKTPYIGQHGWVSLKLDEPHTDAELVALVTQSWRRVAPARLKR